jgi:putative aminopeptidase FrvX
LALSFYINPLITIGIFIAGLYLSYRTLKISTTARIKLSKHEEYNYETQNIFADLKSKNSKGTIIFMAHWDSKSQTYPTSTRILIFLVFLCGSLLLFVIYIILAILHIIFNWILPILNNILLDFCLILAAIGALNYFNKTSNKSLGAYDNAAAVGIILELARFYKLNPLENIDITFLSTSSEELNLGGAGVFMQKYKDNLDRKTTYFINLDLIGGSDLIRLTSSYGIPRRSSSLKLNKIILESAEELQIKVKDIYAPTGVWSDYMPVVQEGFEACWLGSEPGLKYVHTAHDNMNLVSKKGIKMILDLCVDVVKKLENEVN